jgi:hypothetical protein
MRWLRHLQKHAKDLPESLTPTVTPWQPEPERPECGQDSLLVIPIPESGLLHTHGLIAYGLDGIVRGRYPIRFAYPSRT